MSSRAFLPLIGLVVLAFVALPGVAHPVSAASCGDFAVQAFAQIPLIANPDDPDNLDGPDDNGIACDDLPCPCNHTPVEAAIGDRDPPTPKPTSTPTPPIASPQSSAAGATGPQATPSPTVPVLIVPTATPPTFKQNAIQPPSTGSAGLVH